MTSRPLHAVMLPAEAAGGRLLEALSAALDGTGPAILPLDPGLPRELLPARWSGLIAARLFADRHQSWSDAAQQEWKRLNS